MLAGAKVLQPAVSPAPRALWCRLVRLQMLLETLYRHPLPLMTFLSMLSAGFVLQERI